MEIRVEAKETRCGFEPFYENQTIGKYGFSLHPFSECSWEDEIVNLNGKTYTCKKPTREWIYVNPTHHQETLRLAMKFNELADLEANYQLNHHEFYQRQEVERINAINELMPRIHETDTGTPLTVQEEAASKFYKFDLWNRIRKGLIATIAILFTFIVFKLTVIVFFKARTLRSRRRFEAYAEQLQENRKLIQS
jgi:hypothetical protein